MDADSLGSHGGAHTRNVDEKGNLLMPVVEIPLPASQSTATQISRLLSPAASRANDLAAPPQPPTGSPLGSVLAYSLFEPFSSTGKSKPLANPMTPSKYLVLKRHPRLSAGEREGRQSVSHPNPHCQRRPPSVGDHRSRKVPDSRVESSTAGPSSAKLIRLWEGIRC